MKQRLIKFLKRIPTILLAGVKQFCRGLYRIGKAIIDYSQRTAEPRRTETKIENKIEMPRPVEINKKIITTRKVNHDFLKPSGFCNTSMNTKPLKRYDVLSQSDATKPSREL